MPVGNPLTVKVTVPELPLTAVMILAGVPSCGASAMDEESERFRVPGTPELLPLPHAVIARERGTSQENKI